MKENEAPKKIYLNKHPFTGELHDKWLRNKWDDSDIEYTRTDAFIEKAVEYIANNMRCDGYTLQTKAKFIKDFKKCMEGE